MLKEDVKKNTAHLSQSWFVCMNVLKMVISGWRSKIYYVIKDWEINMEEQKPLRDEKGRLLPGQTANRKGTPQWYRKHGKELSAVIRSYKTPEEIVERLCYFAFAPKMQARIALSALCELMNRGWGKSPEIIDIPNSFSDMGNKELMTRAEELLSAIKDKIR